MDQFGFEDFEVSGARPGPKSGAQTPAKPSERKKGSSKNNKKHPSKKVTLSQLKKVYRRGAGAFSQSHRPGQNRGSWAMARVNMFLKMKRGGKVKDSYRKADQDLASVRQDITELQLEDSINVTVESFFDLTEELEIDDESFAEAAIDIEFYKLDYDFQDINELYLDDYQPLGFDW